MKRVMEGEIAIRTRELLREICKTNEVELLKGHISKDHVHLFVCVPRYLSVSKLVQQLKWKSSRMLLSEFRTLSGKFWGLHLWGRGCFVASSGNVTDEVIMEYIKNQDVEQGDDDFGIA